MEPIRPDFRSDNVHQDPKQELVEAILNMYRGTNCDAQDLQKKIISGLGKAFLDKMAPSPPSPPSPVSPSCSPRSIPINNQQSHVAINPESPFEKCVKQHQQSHVTINPEDLFEKIFKQHSASGSSSSGANSTTTTKTQDSKKVFQYNDLSFLDLIKRLEKQEQKMEEILVEMQIIRKKLSSIYTL